MALVPAFIRRSSLYLRYGPGALRSRFRDTGRIFSEIYEKNLWGRDTASFYSGPGSRGAAADAYVELVIRYVRDNNIRRIVDLGCGDMVIGSQIARACEHYTGIDVVEDLIAAHQKKLGSEKMRFACLDIARDPLPAGDLCLVRQVFQHLSNAQIKAALDRMLPNFANIIVTEHFPAPAEFKRPNVDMVAAASTRVLLGSAVVLDECPFGVPCQEILTCPAASAESGHEDVHSRGLIRSFLVRT
ncbi:class I SAM-dependent methyltransferase [Sphingomonas cannabina]|uniref:class I SAM-dependent methyltransferase n=1 Tax=Sphingomonas cannabina TaxID=2899123 RepID=UPI001F1D9C90|nr:class I SAM-dependent methyltransferase [Sphingomonas cannabina]UIJ44829.1 class I SAM-dependent methyltransferase [Sphingomonas cannabina]